MSLSRRFLRRLDCGLASGCALDCHGGREGLFWNIGRTKHRARSLPNIQEKQEPFLTPLSLQVVPLNSWGLGGSLLLLKSLAASTSAPLVLETFFTRTADNYKWANLDESFASQQNLQIGVSAAQGHRSRYQAGILMSEREIYKRAPTLQCSDS